MIKTSLSGRHAAAIKSVAYWLQGGRSVSVSRALLTLHQSEMMYNPQDTETMLSMTVPARQ